MELGSFFGTIILGKIFYPVHQKVARAVCHECEDFIEKGSKILDLGCGRGVLTIALRDYFQAESVGIDIKDQRVLKNFPFQIYDGENLPFPDNSFNITFMGYVLHHAKYPEKVLSEAKRVTKEKIIILEDLPEGILGKMLAKIHQLAYAFIFQQKDFHIKNEKKWEKFFRDLDFKTVFSKRITKRIIWLFPLPQKRIMFVLEKKRV